MAGTAGAHTRGPLGMLLSPAEINRAISSSPRILAAGMAKAQRAQSIWVGHVPEFDPQRSRRQEPPHGQPGDAKAAVRISVIRKLGRIAWRVGSDHFTARWMEFGAKHMPKIAPREKTIAELRIG